MPKCGLYNNIKYKTMKNHVKSNLENNSKD